VNPIPITLIMDDFGLPVLFLRTLTHYNQRISKEFRGSSGAMRGVNTSYELLRINMKKNKKQFNTGKPTKHQKGQSISPSPDRFAIIGVNPKSCPLFKGRPIINPVT
jgi:hypothetical protein